MAGPNLFWVGTGLVSLALILQIVGVATPDWVREGGGHLGLWRLCFQSGDCVNLDGPGLPGWIKTSRAFGILAIITMALAAVFGTVAVIKSDIDRTKTLAPVLCGLGVACSVTSVAVFAGDIRGNYSFSYSFYLCVIAAMLSAAAGTAFWFAGRQ